MSAVTSGREPGTVRFGLWLLTAASLLGLIDAIFNYFSPANGIHGTEGALIVIVSTALQLIAALLILARVVRGWVWWLFQVLILLDLIGTALAAYLLEADLLLALTVLGFIGWLLQMFGAPSPARLEGVAP